ncbi:hypothetical protein [Vibrio mediterranei]|uniref:hypothetical protein n=1 Tax=Vibrio mediterranei TaxID=689 RepID=UPI00148C612B|nr:hypothetical protein [Vibrio mediterranei]NOI26706.1 hypothetical protein [Vibrio mediterranei]
MRYKGELERSKVRSITAPLSMSIVKVVKELKDKPQEPVEESPSPAKVKEEAQIKEKKSGGGDID